MAKRKWLIKRQIDKDWIIPILVTALSITDAFVVQGQNPRSRRGPSLPEIIAQQMLTDGDENTDEAISKNEMEKIAEAWFDRINPDQADLLSREEF
jgi:hypothetical protein